MDTASLIWFGLTRYLLYCLICFDFVLNIVLCGLCYLDFVNSVVSSFVFDFCCYLVVSFRVAFVVAGCYLFVLLC